MSAALTSIVRKVEHVRHDSVLRRWLVDRLIGRERGQNAARRTPDYLAGYDLLTRETIDPPWPDLVCAPPDRDLTLDLPGETIRVEPGQGASVFARPFADTETLLALHRFAWVPLMQADPAWVADLWIAWLDRFATQDDDWAWHPYTAAERLINITNFARTFGLPGPRAATLAALARHGTEILARLEYFGETLTGNHLANNGRGLFLGGIALGLADWADAGGRILTHEAARIFAPSGMLREGSSHYHLLVARWYCDVSAAAHTHSRPEAVELTRIAERALSVIPNLLLPGGLPLIGDVSPDVPPDVLVPWAHAASRSVTPVARNDLCRDGWLRFDAGEWYVLMHASVDGWPPMPGHGHLDCGGFEVHHGTTPIFCDLGRRSYGAGGDADIAAARHNTLLIDDAGVYPENRPYYSDAFRTRIGGGPPTVVADAQSIELTCDGFARLRRVGAWRRTLRFDRDRLTVEDHIDGTGRHKIERLFHTTLPVHRTGETVQLGGWLMAAPGPIAVEPVSYWGAYGAATPAMRLRLGEHVTLPWTSRIVLERA